jgi:hypothetical protein
MRGHVVIETGRGSNIGLWSIRSWLAGEIHKSIEKEGGGAMRNHPD